MKMFLGELVLLAIAFYVTFVAFPDNYLAWLPAWLIFFGWHWLLMKSLGAHGKSRKSDDDFLEDDFLDPGRTFKEMEKWGDLD